MNENNNEKTISVCATCLSFHKPKKPNFPVTEDIQEILRCLLHGFDIDDFFKLKAPDKLRLCEKCHNTIRDMISFKVCVLNSFKEFMKYWYSDKQKFMTYTYTINAPGSSSLAATGNVVHVMEINPLQLNTEPDPLEVKSETENIESIIDIKEETDIIDVNNKTFNLNENDNVINEAESDTSIKLEQEQTVEQNQIANELIYSNVTSAFHNDVGNINNLVINKATVSNVSKQSSYRNIAPKPHNLKHTNNFIINKVMNTNASENIFNSNIQALTFMTDKLISTSSGTNSYIPNSIVAALSNDKLNQNTEESVRTATIVNQINNINVGNDNFYSAATNKDDVENVIHGNLLFKNATANLTNNTLAHTNGNSNIRVSNISHTNNTAITNTNYLDNIIFETNNDNLFKRISVDDGKDVAKSSGKKLKVVKIDYQGNIENVGEALINPFAESTQVISTALQPPVFPTICAAASRVPDTNIIQTVNNECGIPESNTSARELEEEIEQNKPPETVEGSRNVQKKWFIKVVTREEILKNMEERRSDPKFVNSPYKCESCVSVFPTKHLAEMHKISVHAEKTEFTCFGCHASFKSIHRLNAHYYTHILGLCFYYCMTCDFKTKDVEYIQSHICPNAGSKPLRPHDPKTMRVAKFKSLYYCPKCEYLSTLGSCVVLHYNVVHRTTPKVKCEDCGKMFKNKYVLSRHFIDKHSGKQKPVEEPAYCNVCDKWYKSKHTLNLHVSKQHTQNEKTFTCDECEKKFYTAKYLQTHKEFHAAVKTGVKNHKCSKCDKAYYTTKALRCHVRLCHEKKPQSRDHVCEVCGKAFFTKSILKEHSAMHSDERPLKCTFCEDTFKYSGALYTHIKLKHKKKKNGEELRNETKPKETRKGKGQMKKKSKRRKKVESSSSSTEELTHFDGS